MKLIIIVAAIALTHGAKLEKAYLPPSYARSSGGSGSFLQTPLSGPAGPSGIQGNFGQNFGQGFGQKQTDNEYAQPSNIAASQYNNVNANNFGSFGNFEARPERAQAALERNAAILRSDNNNDGETYSYAYETQNGIYAEESGVATNGVEAQGGFSYTGDDGRVYSIRYTADQNGFVPQGDHLPTPPPVPLEILKALEQNARDEAAGIYDDGSYNEAKYADASNQYTNYQNQNQNNFNAYGNGDEDTVVTNSALGRSSGNFGAGSLSGHHSASRSNVSGDQRGSVTAAYLPPFAQRGTARNGGRQNFDARSGYRY